MIRYQKANAKLRNLARKLERKYGRRVKIYGMSLPSGYSCPAALLCLSKADETTGRITDGPETEFRCFSATSESYNGNLRAMVWGNFRTLREARTREAMADALDATFPVDADVMRPGLGGDFFSFAHFGAQMDVARRHPSVQFYAYTKSVNYLIQYLEAEDLPHNVEINGSRGGRHDALLEAHGLKTAVVVNHPSEAAAMGLEIDHDETHAIGHGPSFALLIHGTQPKGSKAAAAIKRLKTEGIEYAYSSATA